MRGSPSGHLKRIPNDLHDGRFPVRAQHGHHVKTACTTVETVPREEMLRHQDNPALLPPGHGLRRTAAGQRPPRLHFYEHQRLPVPGDDVNFANSGAVSPGKNCVPPARQFVRGPIFRPFSKDHTGTAAHGRSCLQTAHQPADQPAPSPGRLSGIILPPRLRQPPPHPE